MEESDKFKRRRRAKDKISIKSWLHLIDLTGEASSKLSANPSPNVIREEPYFSLFHFFVFFL
jgi:hypothetical protein